MNSSFILNLLIINLKVCSSPKGFGHQTNLLRMSRSKNDSLSFRRIMFLSQNGARYRGAEEVAENYRLRLVTNEELEEARDITEQADALVDAIYYICDTAVRHGMNLDRIFEIVHSFDEA